MFIGTLQRELVLLSKLEKLLERIRNNPKTVRFEELDKLLVRAGFVRRQSGKGTSHFVYRKDGQKISIPYNNPYIKQVYVIEAIELLENFGEDVD